MTYQTAIHQTQTLKRRMMKINDTKHLLAVLALPVALSATRAHADLSWTGTSADADQSAVMYIKTEGTSFTADGTYQQLSIAPVE